jgi:hypothetical protein
MNRAALLMADASPCLRWLVLRDLLGYPADDEEVQQVSRLRESDPLARAILSYQEVDGSWKQRDPGEGGAEDSRVLATAAALTRLGALGFDRSHLAVEKGAEYLFRQQRADGAWPFPGRTELDEDEPGATHTGEDMIPLQTAMPLRGLAACGYASDPRSERAYDWLMQQRLADGAWPTGIASGVYRGVGGYRRLAHSRWGCRTNTTAALICLGLHPQRCHGQEARRALDLLLGNEVQAESSLGFEIARLVSAERWRGLLTFFARFDPALVLSLCSQVGAATDDPRVASVLDFVLSLQGSYGMWQYAAHPEVSRWVTYDLLRSLSRLGEQGDWLSLEPRTPFTPYPQRRKRF